MIVVLELILILFLFICALGAFYSERLLIAVVIFMSYSLVMSVIWALLQSPDLAITEAAVGAGISGILFFISLKRIHALKGTKDE